ncbi:permease, partial [Lactobacillus sp. XV13L]|nr:permease [Lactobacillus sp. XV13L]
VLISKSVAAFFPDWITGWMGVVLIILAFLPEKKTSTRRSDLVPIFILCLSLGGDNLAVYIPLAIKMSFTQIIEIAIIFSLLAIVTVVLGKWVLKMSFLTKIIENYGSYGTNLIYIIAGIYIIYKSKLIFHLI